jgi:hypothetical protein
MTTRTKELMPRIRPIACAAALAVAFTISQQPARAHLDRPQPVPGNLQPPVGTKAFLDAHAIGTQNYMCLPSGATTAWINIGPQATLFNDHGRQVTTHFLSINPADGAARPTWQHSRDTSRVWAMPIASSEDPAFVAPGAIPWLLLQTMGTAEGPHGGDTLSRTTYIQRINTVGGKAPTTPCTPSTIGSRVFVPYEADYVFYRDRRADD